MRPKLRMLEIKPTTGQAGEEFWVFNDRAGFSESRALPIEFGPLLAMFDGTRDLEELARDFEKRHGEALPLDFLQNFVDQLDEALLLDSPRFAQHRRDLMAQWNDSPTREATLAGRSYPDDPDELRLFFNDLFFQARELEKNGPPSTCAPENTRGVVVPHIDFHRGGATEALAYRALLKAARSKPFDTLVVLGIAHSGVHYPFCATSKDFDTPLGICPTDREFVSALQERVGPRLKAEQWAHKNEHSVEFVAAFLRHLDAFASTSIVPIICGGFFPEISSGRSPSENSDMAEFARALRQVTEIWESRGKRVGFIASVDGAHVGSPFGDDTEITPEVLEHVEREDRAFWQLVEDGHREGMHAHIARDDNARNVDAHPAVYTLMLAFPELRAQLLHYDRAFHPERNELVTFATLSLCEE
jgi:AmmeMemoRadiSam system protein B